jgi:monofunctional biosynthetic peptidoglycan transglycosylase
MRHQSLYICLTLVFLAAGLTLTAESEKARSMHVLRNFDSTNDEPAWAAQNDGVMGGVSEGRARISEESLRFTGKISLENNGGFAQIYSPTEESDFSAFSTVRLRVKGDGRTYQFRLATDARFRGSRIAYRAEFETQAQEWTEVSIPLDSFQPSHHGRDLSGPPLDLASIRQIALLLGDGVAGPFALRVDWIGLE